MSDRSSILVSNSSVTIRTPLMFPANTALNPMAATSLTDFTQPYSGCVSWSKQICTAAA